MKINSILFLQCIHLLFIPITLSFQASNSQYRKRSTSKLHLIPSVSEINDLISSIPQSSASSMLISFDDFSQSLINDVPSAALILFSAVLGGYGQDDNNIGAPGTTYDSKRYDEFYKSKPFYVIRRLSRLLSTTALFNIRLLLDYLQGNLDKNAPDRAKEALQLATILGPTFIKLGQALAIRTDLLPKAYGMELTKLQDSVAPFDSEVAKRIIKKELRIESLDEVFLKFPDKPIASASIGQVYRATMKDGTEVAVKVQRPNILNEIALDLYLLRLLTPIQVFVSNWVNKQKTAQSDIDSALGLVDEWGRGFVNEVDYRLEAVNTKQFLASMIERQLDAVTAPRVIDALSVDKILTTEWMEGTRLDSDASPDVPRLCGVAVNAYLTMLLDNGIMHCDPHPGNLLRTLDGRLCILDWGMTVSVPKDLQYSLLEFIAHANSEDFDSLPQDFVNLGFSPESKINQLRSSGITEGVSITFKQLNKGGGPTKIRERVIEQFKTRYGDNLTDTEIREAARAEVIERMQDDLKAEGIDVSGVTDIMDEMSKRNKGLFSLPPYMLYVSRALLTLEGIGLNIDPNYSVLQECFPYIARRLMTDNSPRAKNALRSMLVGSGSVLSPEKLKEVADGFSSYTAFTSSTDAVGDGQKEAQLALAKLLLSPEGNVVQDILVEGTAKAADAVARDQMQRIVMSRPGRIIKSLAKSQNDFSAMLPAPLRPLAAPLTLPYFVLNAAEDVLMPQKEDREVLDKLGSMQQVVGSMLASNSSPQPTATSADSLHNPESTQNPVSEMLGALQKQVNDPNSAVRLVAGNADIRSQVPRVAASVSRRLLSSLFNRAAERIEIASKPEVDDIDTSASSSSMDDRLKKVVLQSVLDASARTARSIAKRID